MYQPTWVEILNPQWSFFGSIIEVRTVLIPLAFIALPFLIGLTYKHQRITAIFLLALLPLLITFMDMSARFSASVRPEAHPFDWTLYSLCFLYSMPAFLTGTLWRKAVQWVTKLYQRLTTS